MTRLKYLGITDNQIATLPESISRPESRADLPSLQKLDLRWTNPAATPAWLARLEARGCVVLR